MTFFEGDRKIADNNEELLRYIEKGGERLLTSQIICDTIGV